MAVIAGFTLYNQSASSKVESLRQQPRAYGHFAEIVQGSSSEPVARVSNILMSHDSYLSNIVIRYCNYLVLVCSIFSSYFTIID